MEIYGIPSPKLGLSLKFIVAVQVLPLFTNSVP